MKYSHCLGYILLLANLQLPLLNDGEAATMLGVIKAALVSTEKSVDLHTLLWNFLFFSDCTRIAQRRGISWTFPPKN